MHDVALVDLTIGRLPSSLAEAAPVDRTVLLLTSGHGTRTPEKVKRQRDWRTSLLVEFLRQQAALVQDRPFHVALDQHLALAILEGEMLNADRVSAWLDARRDSLPFKPVP